VNRNVTSPVGWVGSGFMTLAPSCHLDLVNRDVRKLRKIPSSRTGLVPVDRV
jgi:hypothetical protein